MLTNHSRPNTPPSPGDDEAHGAVLPPGGTRRAGAQVAPSDRGGRDTGGADADTRGVGMRDTGERGAGEKSAAAPTDTVPLWVTGPDYTATCVELAVVHVDGHTDQISLDGDVLGCITCSGDDMFTARPGTCPAGDGTCVQAPSWDRAAARILRARGVAR